MSVAMISTRVPASSSDVSPAARLSSRASSRLPGAACARVGTRRQRGGPVGTRAIFGGIFDGGGSKRRKAAKAALLEAIEGMRCCIGPTRVLQYTLQGLFHPARKVRDVYWKIYNNTYLGAQDALVAYYPNFQEDNELELMI